jgi:hypothetical protein
MILKGEKGLAPEVLKPIFSAESTNIGAQKAISRAGFFAGNRIVQFDS